MSERSGTMDDRSAANADPSRFHGRMVRIAIASLAGLAAAIALAVITQGRVQPVPFIGLE
jgi:hypothetical protein